MNEQEKIILEELLNEFYEKENKKTPEERRGGPTHITPEVIMETYKKYDLSFESASKIALEYNKTMIVEELKNRIITNDNREGLIPDIPFEYIQKSYGQEVAQEICDRINEEIKKENERRQGRGGR